MVESRPTHRVITFHKVEEPTNVAEVLRATRKINRALHRGGRRGMLEVYADLIDNDPLDNETRFMISDGLRTIAAKDYKESF